MIKKREIRKLLGAICAMLYWTVITIMSVNIHKMFVAPVLESNRLNGIVFLVPLVVTISYILYSSFLTKMLKYWMYKK